MLKINGWFLYVIFAIIFWGVSLFLPKLATNNMNPKSVLIYQEAGALIVTIFVLWLINFKPETNIQGMTVGILAGITGVLGTLFFLFAISKGTSIITVPATALYPLVSILLAFIILKEPITLKQVTGILFALIAIILLSI